MSKILNLIQIVISALLVACILLQSRGGELSGLFGGSGEVYRTRRGFEKSIFVFTIVLAIVFLGLGIARLIIGQ